MQTLKLPIRLRNIIVYQKICNYGFFILITNSILFRGNLTLHFNNKQLLANNSESLPCDRLNAIF